jgi:hypothetical protein
VVVSLAVNLYLWIDEAFIAAPAVEDAPVYLYDVLAYVAGVSICTFLNIAEADAVVVEYMTTYLTPSCNTLY